MKSEQTEVKVMIEEHLCKEVSIKVPSNVEDKFKYAEQVVHDMYKNKEVVLTSNDFNGQKFMYIEDSKGNSTEWFNF